MKYLQYFQQFGRTKTQINVSEIETFMSKSMQTLNPFI